MKKPRLTDKSFLAHVFGPKRNPVPSGLRERKITSTKGRKTARVNAYNRMTRVNQELVWRSGLREQYLKGEVTLADAKRALRPKAVSFGVAKPAKPTPSTSGNLDDIVAGHVIRQLRTSGYTVGNKAADNIFDRVQYMKRKDREAARNWSTAQIRKYAGDPNNVVEVYDKRFNPLWYH